MTTNTVFNSRRAAADGPLSTVLKVNTTSLHNRVNTIATKTRAPIPVNKNRMRFEDPNETTNSSGDTIGVNSQSPEKKAVVVNQPSGEK